MMTKLLFIKLLRDLRITWGRTSMMVVAINLSLIVFGTMLYARTLVQSNMTSGYVSTNPASARITIIPGAKPDQIEAVRDAARAEPHVIDATMRAVLSLKIQKNGDDSTPLQLFVAAPDDPMRIATFKIERGSWPPPADGILLERSALQLLNLRVGENITVFGFDGKPAQLKITGVVHDQSLALAGQEGGVGYTSTNSLPLLGKPPVLNQLVITVADQAGRTEPSDNRDSVVRKALSVAAQLKKQAGVSIEQVAVPPPYEHPHQQIAITILTALLAFGALSLLLSAILIATMFNGMLTQQIPQIGMMKAVGARSSRILQLYLMMILLVSATATALALFPGIALGRALAQMLLRGAMNIDVTSLSIPWWLFGTIVVTGIIVPLSIALIPLVRASRRTVREALDDRGVVDSQGRTATRLYAWLGRLRGVDRILLMAFRNIFRRRARFLLSVGLLVTAGAIFVSGLNLMAGFQAIPNSIPDEQRWDVEIILDTPAASGKVTDIVGKVPGVTRVEAWNTIPTGVQYTGKINVTRTYPDQGHGSMSLTAIPSTTSMLIPPPTLEGRWLLADDTDAIVFSQTIRKTLPDLRVGDTIRLPIEGRLTTWRAVGIVKELTVATSAYVSQAGFGQAAARPGQANLMRIVTDRHDKEARVTVVKTAVQALTEASIKTQNARPIDTLLKSAEGHSNLLVVLILMIAAAIGTVGLIGLGSTMSTNVIERTREFGVMSAIGARSSEVRRLVVFEGIFIAVVSCVAAIVPALVLTLLMSNGLGNLFFSAPIPFQVSLQAIIIWVIVVALGATLATLGPAYRASRLTVREALTYL